MKGRPQKDSKKNKWLVLGLVLLTAYTIWMGGTLCALLAERQLLPAWAETLLEGEWAETLLEGQWMEALLQNEGQERTASAPEEAAAKQESLQTENGQRTESGKETARPADGAGAFDGADIANRPLLQATGPEDEFLGLVHLGLLETKVNETGILSQSIQNVLPSVVQIGVGAYWGSGVILKIEDDSVILASSRHLLGHQDYSYIRFYNGQQASGRLIGLSAEYDVGFVQANIGDWDYDSRMELQQVAVDAAASDALRSGDEMFLVGSTDGVACNIYEGEVADPWYYFEEFGSYMIYNYCKGKEGMSGGGTYDAQGHFIGLITGGLGDETASLPVSLLQKEYEKLIKNSQ